MRAALAILLVACNPASSGDAVDASSATVDATPGPDAAADTALADAPDSYTDMICTPTSPSTGVLDPDCVYLIGTLAPGSAGHDVLVYPGAPDDYSWGFGYYADGGTIRHTDGKLLFSDSDGGSEAFVWQPDAAPTSGVDPHAMLSNDTVLATPGCTHRTYRAYVFPDDGVAAYRCYRTTDEPESDGNRLFLEGDTTPLVEGGAESPVALGAGRAVLFAGNASPATLSVAADGERTAVDAGTFERVVAARWSNDRFLVALARSYNPVAIDLVAVSRAGDVAALGAYQLGNVTSYWDQCKLEHGGSLVCFAYEVSTDIITRFATTTAPVKIYDESMHAVQLHISSLATGG